ncbi:MAG: hypothetical protein HY560_02820 [Gemmatimonadetes bacterium]|nr:hypothetical protein [Gemmatimonadota bacterium]
MGILLYVLGLLAAASGGFKLRSRERALLGRSTLALAEAVAGAATVLASGMGLGRLRPLAWAVVGGVSALIVLSSVMHVRKAVGRRKHREASEAERLKSYIQSSLSP